MYLTNEQLTEILSQPITVTFSWQHGRNSGQYEEGHIWEAGELSAKYYIEFAWSTSKNVYTPATYDYPSELDIEFDIDLVEVYVYNPEHDDYEKVSLTDYQEEQIALHVNFNY